MASHSQVFNCFYSPMPYKHTLYKTRCQVQALRFSDGWTYRRIADDQNLAVNTVHDICHGPSTPRKTKGRPILLDTPTRCRLVAMATQSAEHRRIPLREVTALCDIEACDRTLHKAFAKEGYARRVARRKPLLNAASANCDWTLPMPTTSGQLRTGAGRSGRMSATFGSLAL